jgi:hypothetical protein
MGVTSSRVLKETKTTHYLLLFSGGGEGDDDLADSAVYHYHPSLEQVRTWVSQAGPVIEEEGAGKRG